MQQLINLYQPVMEAPSQPFSFRTMLILVFAAIVCMALIQVSFYWKISQQKVELGNLENLYQTNLTLIEKLEQTVKDPKHVRTMEAKIARLKQQIQEKERGLQLMASFITGNETGLSPFFTGLARQDFESIWLDEIDIYAGGEQMRLKGIALDVTQFPQYLQALREEDVFFGRQFKTVSLNRQDKGAGTGTGFVLETEARE